MYRFVGAAIALCVIATPALAQNIGDLGRALEQQLLPRQGPDPRQEERERAIYEQGRRDSERGNDQRRFEERRQYKQHGSALRREDGDRYRFEKDHRRANEERARNKDQRTWTGRY